MKKHHTTAFYLETLILIAVFIVIILVLTNVFGLSKAKSLDARLLTSAVSLSENAAEAISASGNLEEAALLLDENGNVSLGEDLLAAYYTINMEPDPEGALCLQASWEPQVTETGSLVVSHISVTYEAQEDPLYSLETAVFLKGAFDE